MSAKDRPWEKLRANRYLPNNKFSLSHEVLARIHRAHLGLVRGLMVWSIDGEAVRNLADVDFTTGGNPARYLYVPANEIWVERWLSLNDFTAIVFHEYIEYVFMKDRGMTYETAHDLAVETEMGMRTKLRCGTLRITSRSQIAKFVEAYMDTVGI